MNNPYHYDPNRPARRYQTHQEEIEEDVPRQTPTGWRIGGRYYSDRYSDRNSDRRNGNSFDHVVTRPAGYVPYQSLVDPTGGHGYDPAGTQYPIRPTDPALARQPVVHRAADRRNEWNAIRPNPVYHPPGATVELHYRADPGNMPPPPSVGGTGQAAAFMQHNPNLVQRPNVGTGPASPQTGPPLQPPRPAPAQGFMQGPMQGPPFATGGPMGPPPLPQAGVRGRGSDPNLRSARGEYGNTQGRGSRGNYDGRR